MNQRAMVPIMTGIRALSEYLVLGIDTTIPFHLRLLNNDVFRSGEFNTKFLENIILWLMTNNRRLKQWSMLQIILIQI